MNTQPISIETLQQKLAYYCSYQERCMHEVLQKLYKLKACPDTQKQVIDFLEKENFINEQRYAHSFAYGKFTYKKWGKQKIKLALQSKNINTQAIQKALDAICKQAYLNTAQTLAIKKHKQIALTDPLKIKTKLYNYLYAKGYEAEIIAEVLYQFNF